MGPVYEVLERHNAAFCIYDLAGFQSPAEVTADFTYVRLRMENYTAKQLAVWKKKFDDWMAQGIDVFAYCKHEDEGKAPAYARQILGVKK